MSRPLRVLRTPRAMQRWAWKERAAGRTVGFVPTMGALHEGHRTLVRRARRENDRVVVSIFVNPTQFGPTEDFQKYPRPFRNDLALCREDGVDVVFAPSTLYAPDHDTWVTVDSLSRPLCGAFRPGHFRGVATVVAQLFNLTAPTRAYFGEKDFQQTRVIARMARDLHFPVRVVPCPTVRESTGLALSSRNRYLSPAARAAAPAVARALRSAAQVLNSRRNAAAALRAARAVLTAVPGLRIQYLAVVDPDTLRPWKTGPAVVAAAVYLNGTRLIDNRRVPSRS